MHKLANLLNLGMRSIKARFIRIQTENPAAGSYINFSSAVRDQNFSQKQIHFWFKILVDPEEYEKKDIRKLLQQLDLASKLLRMDKNEGKSVIRAIQIPRVDKVLM